MKITKRQIRRIIHEEKKRLLQEYELYVDEKGNVYDDEGNVEPRGQNFGSRYGGETYLGTNPPWRKRQSSGPPSTGSVRSKQLAAAEKMLSVKTSNFLQSLVDQMTAGRSLSDKQVAVMKKILVKHDPKNKELFEGKKMVKITKRQLKRIIREEKGKLLERRGGLDTSGPDDYTTYVVSPRALVNAAEEYLTDEELAAIGQDKVEGIAIDNANELAWSQQGSLEGFGSSDRSAYIKYYLEDLGRYATRSGLPSFTADWKGPRGSLQIVRESKGRPTKNQLRRIVREEMEKAAPFGSGMERADLDPEEKELIGHT
jgi:hypothetical protein